MVEVALQPEYRAVVDHHEVLAFEGRFGEDNRNLLAEEQADLPALSVFPLDLGAARR